MLADPAPTDRYTVLKIDPHGRLAELVYLGAEPVEPRNLSMLVGMQEAYLNSACGAYDRGIIKDWVRFFREDWCSSLTHDRFDALVAGMRGLLARDEGANEVIDLLLRALDDGKDDATVRQLRSKAVGVGGAQLMASTRKMLETSAIEFLRKNRALLPRYALPQNEASSGKK
jgi:hypothetical protein